MRFSIFFSNLEMKIQKWTFIFVHFSKIQNRFEKTLHHSFSQLLRSISPKSQYIYPSFYKFLQGLFSFYDSKTSKPHASQSYGSGALCDLMVADFADFWFVTEYAIKSAILHFGCVTIKMQ